MILYCSNDNICKKQKQAFLDISQQPSIKKLTYKEGNDQIDDQTFNQRSDGNNVVHKYDVSNVKYDNTLTLHNQPNHQEINQEKQKDANKEPIPQRIITTETIDSQNNKSNLINKQIGQTLQINNKKNSLTISKAVSMLIQNNNNNSKLGNSDENKNSLTISKAVSRLNNQKQSDISENGHYDHIEDTTNESMLFIISSIGGAIMGYFFLIKKKQTNQTNKPKLSKKRRSPSPR